MHNTDRPSATVVFPAGKILADEFEARDWSPACQADILDQPTLVVSENVSGHRKTTRESATRLGTAPAPARF